MEKIKQNPLIAILMSVTITALTVLMTTSFATVGHVDREIKKINDRYSKELADIKKTISTIDSRVYDMWKQNKGK